MPSLLNTWRFHTPATTITLPKHFILALPRMGARCDRTSQASLLSWPHVHSSSHRLCFKVGWSYSIKRRGAKQVADFIRTHLIYLEFHTRSFRIIPSTLKIKWWFAEKYKFRHSFSSSYNPSSNGQAEVFNKVLCKILKKMVSRSRRD